MYFCNSYCFKMAITITGTAVNGKTKYTFKGSSLARAKKEWSTFRAKQKKKKIILPPALNIVYSGDLVLIYPEWTFMGFANSPQPASGGFEQFYAGTDRSYPIRVSSDEYTHSIINNDTVVILSKQPYTPTVLDTDGFNLAKIGVTDTPQNKSLYTYMYLHSTHDYEQLPTVTCDTEKLCDIYDNSLYTIAVLCNQLAKVNRRFSFAIQSPTRFSFHFAVNSDSTYIPLLYTTYDSCSNVFTPEYFSNNINYFTKSMNWWYNTWTQNIDFTKPYDHRVLLDNRTYFADGSKKISTVVMYPVNIPK